MIWNPKLSKTADKWILGNTESDVHATIGDKLKMLTSPVSEEDVYGDLAEIVVGKKRGRETDRERIVFTHGGMSSLDIGTGVLAYKRAKEKGIGVKVRLF